MAHWLLALTLALALARGARAGPPGPPRCPPAAAQRCVRNDGHGDENTYTVDGIPTPPIQNYSLLSSNKKLDDIKKQLHILEASMHLQIDYTDSKYFKLECPQNLTLDNSAMPRFESQLRVSKAQLKNCPAPRGSYGAVLQRLNVFVNDKLTLNGAGNLTAVHLSELGNVRALEIIEAELAAHTLASIIGLHSLVLDKVRLPPGELRQLPSSLEYLELMRVGADVPREVLERLPKLVKITVRDSSNVRVTPTGSMRELALEMPAIHVPNALAPSLHKVTMIGWDDRWPVPWTSCALHTLLLDAVTAEELPAGWVSNCKDLNVLRVHDGQQLRALHATSLRGARNLQELYLTSCALTALPVGLLDDAVNLRVLDLSKNYLKELPSGLFAGTHSLQELLLFKNKLTTDVFTSVKGMTSLSMLDLSQNDLRDSCDGPTDIVRGVSPLQSLKSLTNLLLAETNTSLICRDWRENMPLLQTLNLSKNKFTSLTFTDLLFHSGENVTVDLSGNDVRSLQYTRHDYLLATEPGAAKRSSANVKLDNSLTCDCYTYWAARALQKRPEHLRLTAGCARSQEPRDIHSVALDTLVCGAPELCTDAPGCACAWRESGIDSPARLLRVDCEGAGLERLSDVLVPLASAAKRELKRVALDDYVWQLYFAHNHITDFSAADFPKHLSVLDLTNNSLTLLGEDDVRALLAVKGRHVRLAHNPLACNCSAVDTLAVMRTHQEVLDYDALTCANGSLLSAARPPRCTPLRGLDAGVVAATAALVTLLAAAALAGLLWHPALRLRLKAALHQRGWLPTPADSDDDDRRFDVFLSFSHGDERFVRDELVARLESGPAPYRLCVHYRDWVPGGWIPSQIAASVRASRRTVAVVSAHFLRSAWARAEFQEAYALALRDARPRLVVVLLDDPSALPLDDKLRNYLATNTYVRWGDPWFWQKLRLALPRSRAALAGRVSPEPLAPAVAPEVPGGPHAPTPEVCLEPSAASSLNSTTNTSSSGSSDSASCSITADSVLELDRLMSPASCGARYGCDVLAYAGAQAVPV